MEEIQIIYQEILGKYPNVVANSVMPSAYDSEERRIAIELFNKVPSIAMPTDSIVSPVIELILTVPDAMWDEYGLPMSILNKRSFRGADQEILGRAFAESATALAMFYGSLKIFEILRSKYALSNNQLIWKRY